MADQTVFFKLVISDVDPNFPEPPEAAIHARYMGTYQCMTPIIMESEFDGYIDYLIKELEHIRREGKLKFAQVRNRLRRQ